MARSLLLSAFLLAAGAGAAWADCSVPAITNLGGLLGDRLVCASKIATGETYQEEHYLDSTIPPGGLLRERARGENDPVDPSYDAGTWSIGTDGSNETVCYAYNGGGQFCFTVHPDGVNTYMFCDAGTPNATGRVLTLTDTCNPPAITLLPRSLSLPAEPG